jgi:hypothetical protein
MKTLHLLAAASAATVLLAPNVMAQSTWDIRNTGSGGTCSQNATNTGTYGNSYGCSGAVVSGGTAAGSSATVSAWSADSGTGTSRAITGSGWANAFMSNQGGSGFGGASRTEGIGINAPDHAFDSILPGTFDMMLVQFDSKVVLSQFKFGWTGKQMSDPECDGVGGGSNVGCDSDVVVMRWDGATGPISAGSGTTSVGGNDMLNSTIGAGGWGLVGTYLDRTAGNNIDTGADLTKGSSYWLIASYNTAMSDMGATYFGNDAFKLNFLRTSNYTCPGGGTPGPNGCGGGGGNVSAPGTLALAGLGLLGAAFLRRRLG